jgi:hypothetical protein
MPPLSSIAAPQQAAGRCTSASLGQRSTRTPPRTTKPMNSRCRTTMPSARTRWVMLADRDSKVGRAWSGSSSPPSGSETVVEALDLASGLLGGPTTQVAAGDRRELSGLPLRRTPRAAVAALLVELLRLGRRAALIGETADGDASMSGRRWRFRGSRRSATRARFDRVPVEPDVAGGNRLRGQRARLVKARRPQPLVDAHALAALKSAVLP